jgi:glutaminase
MLSREDIDIIYHKLLHVKGGKNAQYIRELAKVNPKIYAISIFDLKCGEKYDVGDYDKQIAIESVSKVFTLALALESCGVKTLRSLIGDKTSHAAFNSTIDVENKQHVVNSFANAGAMATCSLLYEPNQKKFEKKLLDNMSDYAGRKLHVNMSVYKSEHGDSDHNMGLAYLLSSYKRFYGDVAETVDVYTKMCSVNVTSQDLALMAATLANDGINPVTSKRVIAKRLVPYIVQHMVSHGMYTESHQWHEEVNLPAKSGVGGAIIIVVPGIMGIAIVSPPLNAAGNSFKGTKTAKLMSEKIFERA